MADDHVMICGMKNAKQSCHKQERTLFNASPLSFMLVVCCLMCLRGVFLRCQLYFYMKMIYIHTIISILSKYASVRQIKKGSSKVFAKILTLKYLLLDVKFSF